MPGSTDIQVRDICQAAAGVTTVAQFKDWIRHEVRHVLPHGALACGHGRLTSAGVSMDYVLTVDYPVEHLAALRNAAGGIETPIMRRWFETRAPILFEADRPWPGVPEEWLAHFRRHQLVNAAVHACYDRANCVGTYFSFHRLPSPLVQVQRTILSGITPLLHETLLRVIAHVAASTAEWPELTVRERDTAAVPELAAGLPGDCQAAILSKAGIERRDGQATAALRGSGGTRLL